MKPTKKNLSSGIAAVSMSAGMKIRKIAAITVLVVSSFAASGVAPSKAELEAMYDKAFREFDATNYEQALKDLDAIDARQPDLAESQNLRGVILMRQKDYANAEKALQKALAADSKFWNARFNLAEIPFLEKKWTEARKRFQELLDGNASELQGEATQLIQYKILITYLMEGKDEMVAAMTAKFELNPDTPAVQYANAAIALHKKNETDAKEALAAAEKNFSPQLNKLFAESLYEVGWLEKPAGQTRAALELSSQAERAAQSKVLAKTKFDEAEQALQQRDYTAARKFIDEADAADPNQPAVINLRGEIFLEQKEFDRAESEFRKALQLDPNYRDAQYSLAQVPFKKKDYATARDRFEALFSTTSGTDKDRAAQLIKFKIYMTLLLEGKDSRAQKMMEQFQFTGDTPALYYAQAAWEFKQGNQPKANDWVNSARKIYPLALNNVFADSFFDLGWLQVASPEAATVASADTAPTEAAPSIEPTPIPAVTLAQAAKTTDPLSLAAKTDPPIAGMEATTSNASESTNASSALAAASPSVETPVVANSSEAASRPVAAVPSQPEPASASSQTTVAAAAAASSPATVLAPAKVREWSQPTWKERMDQWGVSIGMLIFLLAGVLILAWVAVPALRRRFATASVEGTRSSYAASEYDSVEAGGAVDEFVAPRRLAGGPPQVSLKLRASEPAIRRAVMPLSKSAGAMGIGRDTEQGDGLGTATVEPTPVTSFAPPETKYDAPEAFDSPADDAFDEGVGEPISAVTEESVVDEAATFETSEFAPVEAYEFAKSETEVTEPVLETEVSAFEPAFDVDETAFAPEESLAMPDDFVAPEVEEFVPVTAEKEIEPVSETRVDETLAIATPEPEIEELEPVGQGQPIPYLTPAPIAESPEAETETAWEEPAAAAALGAGLAGIGALRHPVDPSPVSEAVSTEPMAQQPTIPAIMPQPTQPTPTVRPTPSSPATAPSGGAPSGSSSMPGGMHTAVQLTLSFEIASLQLTPTFKMGALQLKPTSKIVTMRLAPSQNPAPAMNLQVTFEIASVQLAGNSIGTIRLTPSQQQRPGISSSPAFNVAGLQLVSGAESAPVQITPSQQGQASVHVTAGFQIASVEFSPAFEIASIVLNSSSRNVSVQLPGSGPSAVEGAPVFEITNVQLGGNGEISTMNLNPPGAKRA